ncbi:MULTISPECIES: hypothetical protein [unclassified Streptomyces]|uniref:hypothetical protein n=1 Tax=unclassified Streptomyces TaxID=2593676 RepID=UPI0033BEFDD3
MTMTDSVNPMARKVEEERRAVLRRFDALGAGLAAALNAGGVQRGGWTYKAAPTHYGCVMLRHPRGLGFTLTHENSHRKGVAGRRLTVRGLYPEDAGVRQPEPITVAMDRDPVAMAGDIVRRWLPGYLDVFGQALDNADRADRERMARRALNRRMEQVLPALHAAHVSEHEAPYRQASYWSGGRYSYGVPTARAAGSIMLDADATHANMKLTGVPADVVLKILELLDDRQPLEGVISPRRIEPARPELPSPAQTIPGEVLVTPAADGGEAVALPRAADLLF